MDEEEIDFRIEAQSVIKDISFAVDQIQVSQKLPSTLECAYLNIQTKEKNIYCVQLCVQGFRVSKLHRFFFEINESDRNFQFFHGSFLWVHMMCVKSIKFNLLLFFVLVYPIEGSVQSMYKSIAKYFKALTSFERDFYSHCKHFLL